MKADHIFMVAVDVTDPTIDLDGMRKIVKTSPRIHAWWNHIPGCFLIVTDTDPDQLTDEFRQATRDARLLVMEVKPSISEGWLPEQSWNWIRQRETESTH